VVEVLPLLFAIVVIVLVVIVLVLVVAVKVVVSDDGGNCLLCSDLYRMHPHIFLSHSDLYVWINN
jgi:hypothetical protein